MHTTQNRERLIDEVKKFPVLYDTRHESHRDIDVRDRCWMEISERLGVNSEVLKREWKILRDSLRQALRKTKKGATTKSGVPCKKWRFQNRMSFILPYMTKRSQREIKTDIKLDESEFQSDQEMDSVVWDSPVPGEHDSLELFFASVCQSTKRLPRKYQGTMKRQVLELLLKIEEDCENELSDNKATVYKNE